MGPSHSIPFLLAITPAAVVTPLPPPKPTMRMPGRLLGVFAVSCCVVSVADDVDVAVVDVVDMVVVMWSIRVDDLVVG